MSALVLFSVLLVVVVWRVRKRRRQAMLSGRLAAKPIYQVEPPRRRVGSGLKEYRL